MLPWRYIVVEGVIGVGKTSLDRVIAFATEHGISAAAAFERARLVAEDDDKEASQEARRLYAAVATDYPRSKYAAPAATKDSATSR